MKGILKKVLLGFIVVMHIGLCMNSMITIYYMNHFQCGTYINGIHVAGYKTWEVEQLLEEQGKNYTLVLNERGNKEEKIKASDIEYAYEVTDQVKKIKQDQYPFWWIQGVWKRLDYEVEIEASYNQALLDEKIKELTCLSEENSVAPENAGLKWVGGRYEIVEGNPGSLVKRETLAREIKKAIDGKEKNLSLEEKKCYEVAKITVEDVGLKAKRDALNSYVSCVITYEFGDEKEIIDGEIIDTWLQMDESNEVTLNEEAVRAYVNTLADTYDTLGATRSFNTSVGSTVTVTGGDYGWKINREEEGNILIDILKKGNEQVTRTPVYKQQGWSRDNDDIGESYVEINLTRQYLWFYKEGKLVVEGSIVSGTGSNSHATPSGTYTLDYKQTNAVLRGPGYATPVSYWMPFNGGIGIHDATWRGAFGGNIYVYNGSHGCINTPLSMAKAIFNEIEKGMPVICYKDAA
ncbi:MAG: peptidoglycan-binding protein [Cellulosilyticum sp.]|nr:peptidoglycan-binding protein [Cellulosilyticum sp.]